MGWSIRGRKQRTPRPEFDAKITRRDLRLDVGAASQPENRTRMRPKIWRSAAHVLAVYALLARLASFGETCSLCDFAGLAKAANCGTLRHDPEIGNRSMPKPHPKSTRPVSEGHLPMMQRLHARISQNDLHWLNTMDTQELRALLLLIATAKQKRLDITTLLEEHNRHCTGKDRNK